MEGCFISLFILSKIVAFLEGHTATYEVKLLKLSFGSKADKKFPTQCNAIFADISVFTPVNLTWQ